MRPLSLPAIVTAIVTLALVAAKADAEDVYKWVDSQGHKHFGATPPAGSKPQRVVIPPPSPDAALAPKPKSWQEQAHLSDQRKTLGRESAEQAARRQQEQEQRCRTALRNRDVLQLQRPVYSLNPHGRQYIPDDQRQANLDQAEQQIAAYCR